MLVRGAMRSDPCATRSRDQFGARVEEIVAGERPVATEVHAVYPVASNSLGRKSKISPDLLKNLADMVLGSRSEVPSIEKLADEFSCQERVKR
ncbi:hypothetical protein CSO01_01790 [Cellulomonas soli]|uniref:Uncharacterized protein n=1 Tax=Cellulomonas soli TaxID=931535 RepID=A0A512P8E1_9CELL|nr:hypothetical protein CSO01_01790 [Cellulomonas soli]